MGLNTSEPVMSTVLLVDFLPLELNALQGSLMEGLDLLDDQAVNQWSVVFALVTNYCFRLPKEHQRVVLTEKLGDHFNVNHGKDTTFSQHVRDKFESFTEKICKCAIEELRLLEPVTGHDRKGRTDHVIQYRLLHQNLFINILGIDANIPNMILAPPGHSKTFSMAIATQVLQISKGSRATEFFKARPHLSRVFHFQGSALSTAEQLMQTYDDAKRKEKLTDDDAKHRSKVHVVIDEAGFLSCNSCDM